LYGLASSGTTHKAFGTKNVVKLNEGTNEEQILPYHGVNVFVNSPIYKERSFKGDARLTPNYQWVKSMFKTLGAAEFKSNTLSCTDSNEAVSFSSECTNQDNKDPFDIMG